MVGGVLMAVAAVGVFAAYAQASRVPSAPVVVAARDLRPGEVLEVDDLRTIRADLPDTTVRGTFGAIDALVGRVVLGPLGDGELVQAAAVSDDAVTGALHEVAVTLPRSQIAVGRLKAGERVDVFVTYDERTTSVVRGAAVVQIGAEDGGSLTSTRELTLVVAVPSGDAVAAVVHALRTGEVTVVRSTFAEPEVDDPLEFPTSAEARERSAEDGG